MEKNKVLRKNSNIVMRVIDDETVLLPIYTASEDINCIYTLNNAASQVWKMINGKRTLGEIKKIILGKFDTTAQEVDKEMEVFLKDLKEIKAVK